MDEFVTSWTPVLWHTARAQGAPDGFAQDAVQTGEGGSSRTVGRTKDPQAVMGVAHRHGAPSRRRIQMPQGARSRTARSARPCVIRP